MDGITVSLGRHDFYGGRCYGCYAQLDEGNRRFAFASVREHKKGRRMIKNIDVYRACDACADMDEAVVNAEEERRRFTRIGTRRSFEIFYKDWKVPDGEYCEFTPVGGARCVCGAVSINVRTKYSYDAVCASCARDHRLLGKKQAEARLISKALKELRAEIKAQTHDAECFSN